MRNTNFKFVIVIRIFLAILVLSGCNASNIKQKQIDELMNYCFENGIFSGTILIAENSEVIYNKAFGFSDFESKKKLNTNDAFYLASVSKQFTSMAVMILKERGMLNYNNKLSEYFPQFPDYADKVTIENLMTHTSGIPDYYNLGIYKPGLTNNDVLEVLIRQDSLNFQPGEKYSYSNGGYVLLALIVEKVSGESFHNFLKNNIFDPLGMNNSLVYDESHNEIPNRAIGYNMFEEINDYNIYTSGAGGIFSITEDLFKWDKALYTDKIIKLETLQRAFTPYRLNDDSLTNYGYGWRIYNDDKGKIVMHSGGLAGFRTYIERHLDTKSTIIILTNKGDAFQMSTTEALRNILRGNSYDIPKIPITIKFKEALETKGISGAIEEYGVLKETQSDKYNFGEYQLNSLGYYLLSKERVNDAIEVFKLNVNSFPDAYNTYDSLGEAYMINGDVELAIKNYKKSLELNPDNNNAVNKLKELEQKI
jgi:CubicO group peptidase (beta-lactamase class C family)